MQVSKTLQLRRSFKSWRKKLGMDLKEKKKLIDQLVMDYVNSLDSDESMDEEEKKEVVQKTAKKHDHDDDDEDSEEDEQDDHNDSDYGYRCASDGFLDGSSEENYRPPQQESSISTCRAIHPIPLPNQPKKAIILKRVSQPISEEDECDIFGKLTAKKLRKLPEEKRDSMMIQINQMFYEKRYGRPNLPPSRTQEHITIPSSTALHLAPTQIQAKRIYPLNTIPTILKSQTYVTPAGNVPAAVVMPTNTVPAGIPTAVPKAISVAVPVATTSSAPPVAKTSCAPPVANVPKPANNNTAPAKCAETRYSCHII